MTGHDSPPAEERRRRLGHRARAAIAWALLAAGCLVMGFAVLMPTWRSCVALAHERDALRQQLGRLQDARRSLEQQVAAAKADHPVLMQRLAMQELGLTPRGARIIVDAPAPPPIATLPPGARGTSSPTFGPVANPPADRGPSLLARLTTGPSRLAMLGIAALAVLTALLLLQPRRPTEFDPLDADVGDDV